MKKAILFPGQGSQYRGMGKKLFSKYAAQTQAASEILSYDLIELCLKDADKKLRQTQFTQPALYVVNHLDYLEQRQKPDYLIGHSLGEYNALLAAGAFDFETGLKLVQKRGELMAAASDGAMAAVIGLKEEQLKEKLQKGGYQNIDIANYNTPTQIVLSGKKEAIQQIIEDFKTEGIRVVALNVSAPFHSKFMQPAAEKFALFLDDFEFQSLKIPVIANVTARPYQDTEIAANLSQQIASSVKWTETIRYLMGKHITDYQELGRGILTKMVKEIRENCSPMVELSPFSANGHTVKKLSVEKNKIPESAQKLGSAAFRKEYGVDYSYVAGGMYKGIASKALVARMAKAKMLSYLGTAGMSLKEISQNIDALQECLSFDAPYGMNLIHDMRHPIFEMQTVELYLEKGITNIEASAFMQVTEAVVYFLAKGLEKSENGEIIRKHKIMAKISRPEVAEAFMSPAPEKLLSRLLEGGKITEEQAALAQRTPVCYDLCVEADSGGHTDAGIAMVLLPAIQRLRDDIQKKFQYPHSIRVGLAGGIGTPQSIASAFVMGADFVLTGSINQCTIEAGTSDLAKDLLEGINVQDTAYAPAGDMFEIGARVQVLKKGVLFAARANKLYNLYTQYASLEDIPKKTIAQLEKSYFKKPLAQIWEETQSYLKNTGRATEIQKAEANPKHKMALVFRWYFGYSSRSALAGDKAHKVNFQIHTGPSLGAFNQWVKGTELENWRNRHSDEIGIKLMNSFLC